MPVEPSPPDARSRELFARARQVLVGGVNSPVRAMRGIGRDPLFIDRAEGAHVWDADGNRYVDFLGAVDEQRVAADAAHRAHGRVDPAHQNLPGAGKEFAASRVGG